MVKSSLGREYAKLLTDKLWKRILIVLTFPIWFVPFVLGLTIAALSAVIYKETIRPVLHWIRTGKHP